MNEPCIVCGVPVGVLECEGLPACHTCGTRYRNLLAELRHAQQVEQNAEVTPGVWCSVCKNFMPAHQANVHTDLQGRRTYSHKVCFTG